MVHKIQFGEDLGFNKVRKRLKAYSAAKDTEDRKGAWRETALRSRGNIL